MQTLQRHWSFARIQIPDRRMSRSLLGRYLVRCASSKYLGQVKATEVSRKDDEARAKQTAKEHTTFEKGN